ncbi:MAG: cupredoxin domain-containing protein [Candidatus Humimicrobiaceae bacterium]
MRKYKYLSQIGHILISILIFSVFAFSGCSKNIENTRNETPEQEAGSVSQSTENAQIAETSLPAEDKPEETISDSEDTLETNAVETTSITTTSSDKTSDVPSAQQIIVVNDAFNPQKATIKAGGTITWINNDGYAHTIASDLGAFNSGIIANGGQFSFTFSSEGSYGYICEIHPYMKGLIIVVR